MLAFGEGFSCFHVIHHMATDRWPDNHWLLERSWKIQVLQKVAKYKLLPVELFASAFNTSVSYRYVQIISMFQGVICVALFWEGLGYRQPVLRLRTRSSRSLACCFGGAFTLESYNFSQKNHKPWVSWPSKLAILHPSYTGSNPSIGGSWSHLCQLP